MWMVEERAAFNAMKSIGGVAAMGIGGVIAAWQTLPEAPEAFAHFLAEEHKKWTPVVRKAGITSL
jgi:hypothetical protein